MSPSCQQSQSNICLLTAGRLSRSHRSTLQSTTEGDNRTSSQCSVFMLPHHQIPLKPTCCTFRVNPARLHWIYVAPRLSITSDIIQIHEFSPCFPPWGAYGATGSKENRVKLNLARTWILPDSSIALCFSGVCGNKTEAGFNTCTQRLTDLTFDPRDSLAAKYHFWLCPTAKGWRLAALTSTQGIKKTRRRRSSRRRMTAGGDLNICAPTLKWNRRQVFGTVRALTARRNRLNPGNFLRCGAVCSEMLRKSSFLNRSEENFE